VREVSDNGGYEAETYAATMTLHLQNRGIAEAKNNFYGSGYLADPFHF